MSQPLIPAFLNPSTGEVLVRVPRDTDDLYSEADGSHAHAAGPVGRVKIQTYRGPSKGDYDFAPWGYYNTQPDDLIAAGYH
jgi:hypothetical protein